MQRRKSVNGTRFSLSSLHAEPMVRTYVHSRVALLELITARPFSMQMSSSDRARRCCAAGFAAFDLPPLCATLANFGEDMCASNNLLALNISLRSA